MPTVTLNMTQKESGTLTKALRYAICTTSFSPEECERLIEVLRKLRKAETDYNIEQVAEYLKLEI